MTANTIAVSEANLTALHAWIDRIGPLDPAAMAAARLRQDRLTKPLGALGRLEALAEQVAGITGQTRPRLAHKVIVVMAGDHGVTVEGVSAYPSSVTGQMVQNFLAGGAAINALARQVGGRVVVVDMGVASDLPPQRGLLSCKVAAGTENLAVGPAMSRDQAIQAILAGAAVVEDEIAAGLDMLGTGEMGIGNTTPAAAIAAALTGRDPSLLAGRGTGLDPAGVARKAEVVRRALAINRPDPADGLDVLSKVGGYEIAGLAGAILAAAANRRPVLVDGVIATAAAMIAVLLAPQVRPYLIAAHRSAEPGHDAMLTWLRLQPLLDLGLRLGEGTGAALGMQIVEAACRTLDEMATFGEAGVDEAHEGTG
jgi:nicotinate-nucleotide--dimethylbenzimidazole phosphoribosyltransferase